MQSAIPKHRSYEETREYLYEWLTRECLRSELADAQVSVAETVKDAVLGREKNRPVHVAPVRSLPRDPEPARVRDTLVPNERGKISRSKLSRKRNDHAEVPDLKLEFPLEPVGEVSGIKIRVVHLAFLDDVVLFLPVLPRFRVRNLPEEVALVPARRLRRIAVPGEKIRHAPA